MVSSGVLDSGIVDRLLSCSALPSVPGELRHRVEFFARVVTDAHGIRAAEHGVVAVRKSGQDVRNEDARGLKSAISQSNVLVHFTVQRGKQFLGRRTVDLANGSLAIRRDRLPGLDCHPKNTSRLIVAFSPTVYRSFFGQVPWSPTSTSGSASTHRKQSSNKFPC